MFASTLDLIRMELGGLYGEQVIRDINDTLELYELYEGTGQKWQPKTGQDYAATVKRTNFIKFLIKETARFMMGREPELRIIATEEGKSDEEKKALAEKATELEKWLLDTLSNLGWQDRLIKAARDCFIGKRVALVLSGAPGKPLGIQFRPSMEFVYEVDVEDADIVRKVTLFYQTNEKPERADQRIWKKTFRMEGGRCRMDEAIFDGNGRPVETRHADADTGLDFLPVYVIINDGLSGDLIGESDVREIAENQDAYNRLNSDDQDALKFNMFPQRVFTDATEESLEKIKIAPGAMVDLQTDPASREGRQAQAKMLESSFGYDSRFENAINRIKNDMYALLSVPNVGLEQLKGIATSGKAMRALYWGLISRCEERWNTWDAALRWMVRGLIKMAGAYNTASLPDIPYRVKIEHLFPIPEDEEEERDRDLTEVAQQVRSRQSYIGKWQPEEDAKTQWTEIIDEQRLTEDMYNKSVRAELENHGDTS